MCSANNYSEIINGFSFEEDLIYNQMIAEIEYHINTGFKTLILDEVWHRLNPNEKQKLLELISNLQKKIFIFIY